MREDDLFEPEEPPEPEDDLGPGETDNDEEGLSAEEHFGLTPPD